MSCAEGKLLRTLATRGPLTRAAARTDTATVEKLVAEGLVRELAPSRKGAAPKLMLTSAGQSRAATMPPAQPSLSDVYRELRALRNELKELKELLLEPAARPTPRTESFEQRVKEAAKDLDRRLRLGGLIPIPALRDALADLGLSQAAFDDALIALEDQYVVDLKVANDPARLADAPSGIHVPYRGLLYFVVLR